MRRTEHKSEKRKRLFMSIFIVLIMTLSVFGFMMGRDSVNKTKYNEFKFTQLEIGNQIKWVAKINKKEVAFDYFPAQLEGIEVDNVIIERVRNSPQIDMTSDFNSTYKEAIALSQFELSRALAINEQFSRIGFTQENEYNLDVITCKQTTTFIPVLMFKKSNETKIYEENNCIIITAKSQQDFLALKDRLLYGVFGVI